MYKLMNPKALLVLSIILIAALLRFYKLSEYPVQLNHDEVSQLYDTASIMQTGKDIYGNFLPLAFPSTGDYKVGHYIYISTISYLIFGDKEITIRIPAAFFGTLTVLAVFLFVNSLTKNWILAILSASLVAITPSEIFYSRKSFENVIGVCLNFFGLFFLLNTLDVKKNKLWGYIGAVIFSLSMYIYTSQIIIVPLLLLSFTFIFKNYIRGKQFLKIFSVWFILLTPLIFMTLTNPNLRFRAASVFITQDVNLGSLISLGQDPFKSYIDFIFLKYLNQFNPIYLFANGLDFTNQGILGVGPLLLWQLPFVILGIIFLIRTESFKAVRRFLFTLVVISVLPSAITFESYSPHRAMFAFSNISIISAFGLYWLIQMISTFKIKKLFKAVLFSVIITAILFNVTYFVRMYTASYPFEKSQKIQYPFKQIAQFIWSEYDNFDSIVFDPQFGQIEPLIGVGAQYYLAYYGHYAPFKLQKEYRLGAKPREIIFDKFSIRQVYWPEDQNLKNTLLIASVWSVPVDEISKGSIIKRFNFYDGTPAFYAIKL